MDEHKFVISFTAGEIAVLAFLLNHLPSAKELTDKFFTEVGISLEEVSSRAKCSFLLDCVSIKEKVTHHEQSPQLSEVLRTALNDLS